eukprot:CAMPEP_0176303904 /NCGR_PEP_ID=MMETSP0121_2-20121125/62150_1 /TAXON_ID=160619 /ORGANISM="Kryptoperidinium foliaceum, Strain CCMP 1326" /LENGTH=211 /DNA_ID=CAMNT_0017645483 /DNA_START=61 /DNA_END=692 /DNA_ORIENTATION=+
MAQIGVLLYEAGHEHHRDDQADPRHGGVLAVAHERVDEGLQEAGALHGRGEDEEDGEGDDGGGAEAGERLLLRDDLRVDEDDVRHQNRGGDRGAHGDSTDGEDDAVHHEVRLPLRRRRAVVHALQRALFHASDRLRQAKGAVAGDLRAALHCAIRAELPGGNAGRAVGHELELGLREDGDADGANDAADDEADDGQRDELPQMARARLVRT